MWRGSSLVHAMNCLRIGLKSPSRPAVIGPRSIAPATPKNFHQTSRADSRPCGRKGFTLQPARCSPNAAVRTAALVSAVTGVRPSSSKYPILILLISFRPMVRTGTGAELVSPSSYPCITSNRARRSATVRAIGPTTPIIAKGPTEFGKCPVAGIRPGVGFRPHIPVKCAGTRIEPPPSLPTPPAEQQAAIAAASPPLEPPAVRDRSHGLLVRP